MSDLEGPTIPANESSDESEFKVKYKRSKKKGKLAQSLPSDSDKDSNARRNSTEREENSKSFQKPVRTEKETPRPGILKASSVLYDSTQSIGRTSLENSSKRGKGLKDVIETPREDKRDAKLKKSKKEEEKDKRRSFRKKKESFYRSDREKSEKSGDEKKRKKRREYDYTSGEDGYRARHLHKPRILEFKRNEIGEIVYKGHPSWVLMQNIQTGIRHYVGKNTEVMDENALKQLEDFERSEAFFKSPLILRFPPEGSQETQPHKNGLFKFKDYCPLVFRHIRQKFGIDPGEYMVSLCHTLEDGLNALRELPTPGKSGSLFFFSHDMNYILKTIPKHEAKLLRFLLPSYYKHVMENSNTLLPKFFGLHRVKPHKGRQVRFVVMDNVFATNKKIHRRYDLKGSTLGRALTGEEQEMFQENATYKDINWRQEGRKLRLGPEKRELFLKQLEKDCKLLEKLNIMDYSLLVGIHRCHTNEGSDCTRACYEANKEVRRARKEKEQESKSKKRKEKKSKKSGKEKQKEEKGEEKGEEKVENGKEEEETNGKEEEEAIVSNGKEETKATDGKEEEPNPTDGKEEEPEPPKTNGESKEGQPKSIKSGSNSLRRVVTSPLRRFQSHEAKEPPTPSSRVQTSFPLPSKFKKEPSIFKVDDGGMRAMDEFGQPLDEYYFVGIIDILMLYSLRKRAERTYKMVRFGGDGKDISSINPVDYSRRFQEFLEENTV